MAEPISGDMTVSQALKANRAADIAARLNLSAAQVKSRLNRASPNTKLRTLFEDEWEHDLIGVIGRTTAARARDERFVGLIAWSLGINAHEVHARVDGAAGNSRVDTLFSSEWPHDSARDPVNRRARDYIGNQLVRWIRTQDLTHLIELVTNAASRSIRTCLRSGVDDAKVRDVFVPWPGAPQVSAVTQSPSDSRDEPRSAPGHRGTSNASSAPGPASSALIFPQPLIDAYRCNNLAILFGSGLSLASDVSGQFPRWTELPERLLEHVARQGIWTQEQINARRTILASAYIPLESMLAELDSLKTALRGTRKYRAALTSIFRPGNAQPGEVHRALVDVGANVLLTTNYDELLESVEGPPVRRVYTWQKADKALDDAREGLKILFKIHGSVDDDDSVVMTRSEYEKSATYEPYRHAMTHFLQTHTFLLVGYGINDPLDLDLVFGLSTRAFGSAARTHYALVKDPSGHDRDRWQREMNIQTLPYSCHGELPVILRALARAKTL